jgi:hypothetical protein
VHPKTTLSRLSLFVVFAAKDNPYISILAKRSKGKKEKGPIAIISCLQ